MAEQPVLLGLGVLTTRFGTFSSREEMLHHVDRLLASELAGREEVLDILLLPEAINTYGYVPETAWAGAESLQSVDLSPTLGALRAWATRYRAFVGCTVLEADVDGHFYNSFVLACPDGQFATRRGVESGTAASPTTTTTSSSSRTLHLVRKNIPASLEGFIFTSGQGGWGSDLDDHLVNLDISRLLEKKEKNKKQGLQQQRQAKAQGPNSPAAAAAQAPVSSASRDGAAGSSCKVEVGANAFPSSTTSSSSNQGQQVSPAAATTTTTITTGISICAETLRYDVISRLAATRGTSQPIQLLLSPFSAPVPMTEGEVWTMSPAGFKQYMDMFLSVPATTSRLLGCHMLMCDKCGPMATGVAPLLGLFPVPGIASRFSGTAKVMSPAGQVLAEAAGGEGLALALVPLEQLLCNAWTTQQQQQPVGNGEEAVASTRSSDGCAAVAAGGAAAGQEATWAGRLAAAAAAAADLVAAAAGALLHPLSILRQAAGRCLTTTSADPGAAAPAVGSTEVLGPAVRACPGGWVCKVPMEGLRAFQVAAFVGGISYHFVEGSFRRWLATHIALHGKPPDAEAMRRQQQLAHVKYYAALTAAATGALMVGAAAAVRQRKRG